MSRSRHPQCSRGRGCGVCGDAGEVRREREEDAARVDALELDYANDAALVDLALEQDAVLDDAWDDHADCEQCTGYSDYEIESYECATCGASFLSEESAALCCAADVEHLDLGGEG